MTNRVSIIPAADAAERLIDHALSLRWEQVAEPARAAARAFLLDSLAVGAAGAKAVHADAVLSMVQGWGEGGQAGILGRPSMQLPAASAAFINAFQIHGQEFDCVHEQAVLHPMSAVLGAVLAETARGDPVDGRRFLTALLAGVDVAVTLGMNPPGLPRFFRPATTGIFGSVAAIASLRQMPRAQALDAFGHALAFASGTMQAHTEGKPALPMQVGNAARSALMAIDLARGGVPGVTQPIEGTFGFLALMDGNIALEQALAWLGQGRHRLEDVSWKPFPTGRAGHGVICAVQQLIARHRLTADQVGSLDYLAPPLIHRLVGRPSKAGMEPGYARLCGSYLAAVALVRGTVGLEDFTPQALADEHVLALAARISVLNDGNPDPAAFVPAQAAVHMRDGTTLHEEVSALFGSPDWPLSEAEQHSKARDCLAFVGLEDRCDALIRAVAELDFAPDALLALRATEILA